MNKIRCPKCGGSGVTTNYKGQHSPCNACRGKGTLTHSYWKKMTDAQRLARLALKVMNG